MREYTQEKVDDVVTEDRFPLYIRQPEKNQQPLRRKASEIEYIERQHNRKKEEQSPNTKPNHILYCRLCHLAFVYIVISSCYNGLRTNHASFLMWFGFLCLCEPDVGNRWMHSCSFFFSFSCSRWNETQDISSMANEMKNAEKDTNRMFYFLSFRFKFVSVRYLLRFFVWKKTKEFLRPIFPPPTTCSEVTNGISFSYHPFVLVFRLKMSAVVVNFSKSHLVGC